MRFRSIVDNRTSSIRRLPGGFWTCENAFTACHHSQQSEQSDTSVLGKPSFLQSIRKKKKKGKRHNRHHPQERCGRLRLRTSTPSQFPTRLNVILGKLLGYRDHQNDSIFNYGVSATCWSFQPCIRYASHAYHHVPQCVVQIRIFISLKDNCGVGICATWSSQYVRMCVDNVSIIIFSTVTPSW